MTKDLVLIAENDSNLGFVLRVAVEQLVRARAILIDSNAAIVERARVLRPAVIVLDWSIFSSSQAIVQALRRSRSAASIPVVALADSDIGMAASIDAGCAACLRKPFSVKELASTLERFLVVTSADAPIVIRPCARTFETVN